ncbi:MAG: putative metal-binding motif-containing protein [Myxococcaceae bacterium]|nr:putative metal-binding motif-containing protein [Myxococcaceae bacterium]
MRTRRAVLLACALAVTLACYRAPDASGPYQCLEDQSCGEGMVCDDGLCCVPGGAPACRTRVPESGICPDGSKPTLWSLDRDGDGLGDPSTTKPACAQPYATPPGAEGAKWVPFAGDCDDRDPGAFPGAPELCDGRDNDCDGVPDDGLPQRSFYVDADGDGAGDENGEPLALCAARPGTVDNASDCNDGDAQVRPGAPERCNDEDDDCNGLKDDEVPGLGEACTDGARIGVCQAGKTACDAGQVVCSQVVFADVETCNGLDDDCNGVGDDSPGCGGPADLLSGVGVSYGARKLTNAPLAEVNGCMSTAQGTPAVFNSGTWLVTDPVSQVAWVAASGGTAWDLRKPGLNLRLGMGMSVITFNGPPVFSDTLQPVVLLCNGDTLVAKYQPTGVKLPNSATPFEDVIPLATGGNGWTLVTPNPDLSQVKRVELVMEPRDGPKSVNIRVFVTKLGFETAP